MPDGSVLLHRSVKKFRLMATLQVQSYVAALFQRGSLWEINFLIGAVRAV
jgi:hypothetical protein